MQIAYLPTPPKSYDKIAFQRCGHVTPSAERGTERFEYTLGTIELACDIEYEAAERGKRDGYGLPETPDYNESATLCAAYVRDTDISELLSDDQREEIETAFLEQGGAA